MLCEGLRALAQCRNKGAVFSGEDSSSASSQGPGGAQGHGGPGRAGRILRESFPFLDEARGPCAGSGLPLLSSLTPAGLGVQTAHSSFPRPPRGQPGTSLSQAGRLDRLEHKASTTPCCQLGTGLRKEDQ